MHFTEELDKFDKATAVFYANFIYDYFFTLSN